MQVPGAGAGTGSAWGCPGPAPGTRPAPVPQGGRVTKQARTVAKVALSTRCPGAASPRGLGLECLT